MLQQKMNQLFSCFEFHHYRLERLEAAPEWQAAIQLQHNQLDTVAARRNGMLANLEKMVHQEIKKTAKHKK